MAVPSGFIPGWLGIDETQRACAAAFPPLAVASPKLFAAPLPQTKPIALYKAWRDVLGHDPSYPAQQIGDCVSFGHGHANDLLQCIEIKLGEEALYEETDTEFIYATSRMVAGILNSGDGSYGAAAIKAMMSVGMVSREMLGLVGHYRGERARRWGTQGPPAAYVQKAENYKLGAAAQVTTWDELVVAIGNGYPVTFCTQQGFTLERDEDGFCTPEGEWGHCMAIGGVRFDRQGACVLQSWGPDVPTGPLALGQPTFSFWVERHVIERILAEGDSWAIAKAPEFAHRPVHQLASFVPE
jgi:hypothetical protein